MHDHFDGMNRLDTHSVGSGADTRRESYGYDAFGERTGLTDGDTQPTGFSFDAHGQMSAESPPQGASIGYGYTPAGRLNRKTDRLGRVWNARYDGAGRLVHEDFAGPQGGLESHDYHYGRDGDGTDQLLWVQDPTGRTDFSYGHRGRLDTVTREALGRKLKHDYDGAGNLSGLTLEDLSGAVLGRCAYHYDALNRMDSFTDWSGAVYAYGYDSASQLRKVTCTLAGKSSPLYTAVCGYDAAGRLLSITYRRRSSGPVLAKLAYDYDAAGNRTARRSVATSAGYSYDTLDQLTGDQDPADQRGPLGFSYDKAGNRLSETWGNNTQAYHLGNSLNQLAGATGGPYGRLDFGYDAEGNRVAKTVTVADGVVEQEGNTGYQWDGKNRLAQVTLPDTTTVSYAYDFQNRMVSRTHGSEVRTYLYGTGTQVLEETLNGQRLALYGWGADGLDSRVDANGQTLFYLKDALGSVIAIVDDKGSVVQSYEYSASGECLSGKDAVNTFRFIGGATLGRGKGRLG